jgi:hypothetical protein
MSRSGQKFASVLDNALREGVVRITRRDGRAFTVQPVNESPSPLAVKGVKLKLKRAEIVAVVREGRERERGD